MAEQSNLATAFDPVIVPRSPIISIRAIAAIAAPAFGISLATLVSDSRKDVVVKPRQAAMWLAHRHHPSSLPQIGRAFGGYDHTTVLHAVKAVETRIAHEPDFAALMAGLGDRINAAEVAAWDLVTAVPSPAARQAAEPDPLPRVVLSTHPTSRHERVLDAVGRYLDARAREEANLYAKGEREARAAARDAFQVLADAYADEPAAARRSA